MNVILCSVWEIQHVSHMGYIFLCVGDPVCLSNNSMTVSDLSFSVAFMMPEGLSQMMTFNLYISNDSDLQKKKKKIHEIMI